MNDKTRDIFHAGRHECPVYTAAEAAEAGLRSLTTPIIMPHEEWILESIAGDMARLPAGTAWGVVMGTAFHHGRHALAVTVWRAGMERASYYIPSGAQGFWRKSITGGKGE